MNNYSNSLAWTLIDDGGAWVQLVIKTTPSKTPGLNCQLMIKIGCCNFIKVIEKKIITIVTKDD